MTTTPVFRLEERQRSETEVEILLTLLAEPPIYLRRGQIHQRLKAESRPTPARVGQLLAQLAGEGLLERVHAAARGNHETAFYSLSARGKELAAQLGQAIAPRSSPPPSEVAEAVVARYDAGKGLRLPHFDFSGSGLVEEVIEVDIDAAGNVVSPRNEELRPGRALLAVLRNDAGGRVPPPDAPPLESLFGLLKARRSVPLDEMDRVLRERARALFDDRR